MMLTKTNMSTSTVHDHQNVQCRNHSNIPPWLRRLASLQSLKLDTDSLCSKGRLAQDGFYYVAMSNQLKCDGCDFETEFTKPGIDLFSEHAKHSPNCDFALKQAASPNNSIMASQTNLADRALDSKQQDEITKQDEQPACQTLFLQSYPEKRLDQLRLNTFSNWPLITPSSTDMTCGGWTYTNIADRVICIHCNVIFHQWKKNDRPYEIHKLKSPNCSFMLSHKSLFVPEPSKAIQITKEPNTQVLPKAIHPNFSLMYQRYESFKNFPCIQDGASPSIQSFADAGFFYTGKDSVVRCFYCDGALTNWQASDDPKVEHCRWFPNCSYIRQYVGKDLFEAIQRRNRELKQVKNSCSTANDQNSSPTPKEALAPFKEDEIDRMTKARMDLPIVEKLVKQGFRPAVIRKAFEIQLKQKHDDFKSDDDLRLACLVLELQVRVIGGDQNNILVPKEWKEKIESPQISTSQLNSLGSNLENNNQSQNTVAQENIKPSTILESGDDTMLCVICYSLERQLACLPCGHLTTCVSCGYSLKTCPICRAAVRSLVRVYV